jgi:hypothetical protein
MLSSGIWLRVALVWTHVLEEYIDTIIRAKIISEPGPTMEVLYFSETSALTRATRRHIPENDILYSLRVGNFKPYTVMYIVLNDTFVKFGWKYFEKLSQTCYLIVTWYNYYKLVFWTFCSIFCFPVSWKYECNMSTNAVNVTCHVALTEECAAL